MCFILFFFIQLCNLFFLHLLIAVDIWAVGIILLCILSRCYPFFDAPDDLTALAEQITLFGTTKIKNLATLLSEYYYYNFVLV